MASFMPENTHAFRGASALNLENLLTLELHKARVDQIERDRDSWRGIGAEPFVRDPGMRLEPDAALIELFVETGEAAFEPCAVERDLEILEPQLQQLIVG